MAFAAGSDDPAAASTTLVSARRRGRRTGAGLGQAAFQRREKQGMRAEGTHLAHPQPG